MNLTELKKKIREDKYARVFIGDAPVTYADYTMDDVRELVKDHDKLEKELGFARGAMVRCNHKDPEPFVSNYHLCEACGHPCQCGNKTGCDLCSYCREKIDNGEPIY